MAAPKADINPFARRTYLQRLKGAGQYVARIPGLAWKGFKNWPKWFRILFTLLAVTAIGYGAFEAVKRYNRTQRDNKIQAEKTKLQEAIYKQEDKQRILELCNAILALNPAEQQTLERKKAVETGEVDPRDIPLYHYITQMLEKEDRKDDLLREALKRLKLEPNDYLAHVQAAKIEIERRNFDAAKPHLDFLASPNDAFPHLNLWTAYRALIMIRAVQRDVTNVRQYIGLRIGREFEKVAIQEEKPETQSFFLQLYAESFELPKLPQDSGMSWPRAQKIAQKCFDAAKEKNETNVIRNLANMGELFAKGLNMLRASSQISDQQKAEYSADLEQRTRKAWEYIIEREPKNAQAYVGLLMCHARANQMQELNETLNRGLAACGENPQLLMLLANLTLGSNFPQEEIRKRHDFFADIAKRNPETPYYWILTAQFAEHINNRQLVRDALANARKNTLALPDGPMKDALLLEADTRLAAINSGTGYPEMVLSALAPIPDLQIARMPKATQMLARALAEIGDGERLDGLLAEALKVSEIAKDPQPVFYAALGVVDAYPPTAERAKIVADYLESPAPRWRQYPAISQLRAKALVRIALLTPGPVSAVNVTRATTALEDALNLDPNHPETLADLLMLRVRFGSETSIKSAAKDIDPLISKRDQLTPELATSLGMVLVANKRYDEAIGVLQPYMKSRATAAGLIELARAYHGQGRYKEAEEALSGANRLPMSERDSDYYREVRELFSRVKQ